MQCHRPVQPLLIATEGRRVVKRSMSAMAWVLKTSGGLPKLSRPQAGNYRIGKSTDGNDGCGALDQPWEGQGAGSRPQSPMLDLRNS